MPDTIKVREQLERLLGEGEGASGNTEAEGAWAAETKRLVDAFLGPQRLPPNAHSEGYYEFTFAKSHAERVAILRAILLSSSARDGTANPVTSRSHDPRKARHRAGDSFSHGEQDEGMALADPSGRQEREIEPTQYDVFISFKNLLPDGNPTRDSVIARQVHDFLEKKALSVFLSSVSLERLGTSEYKKAIDDALDAASVLVAVGTSREHLEWRWVRYEWDSFFNDILSGFKPSGRVFAFIEGMRILDLPRSLRQAQTFVNEAGALDALFNFISNALEKAPAKPAQLVPKAERPLDPPARPVTRAKHDVFFIYAYADHAYVNELGKELRKRGLNWTENTMMGDPPDVARLLAESSFVVFVDSSNAKGAALYQELDVARGMGKPIIPVRIEHVSPRSSDDPLRFVEAIQYFDARRVPLSDVAEELAKIAGSGLTSR
jgi:hypothetical protein